MSDIQSIIAGKRASLAEATSATEAAMRQAKQQLDTLQRNYVAIAAQKALLDEMEKELNPIKTNEQTTTAS